MTRILESIVDGAAICDLEWRFTFVNQRGAKLVGRSPEELIGQSLWETYPLALGSTRYTEIQRVLTEQTTVHFHVFHSGLDCWLEVRAYPLPAGVLILHQDITAWKQTEVELQQTCESLSKQIEEQTTQLRRTQTKLAQQTTQRQQAEDSLRITNNAFAHLLESITDGFCAVDTQWRFTYINRRAEHLLQKFSNELLSRNLWDIYPHLQGSTFYHRCYEAARTGQSNQLETFCSSLNRWFSVTLYPSSNGIAFFFQDITDRRCIEQERDRLLQQERTIRTQAQSAHQRCLFLSNASAILASSLNYETTLSNVAQLAVPLLADFCLVHKLEPDGTLRQVIAWHCNQEQQSLVNQLGSLYTVSSQNLDSFMAQVLQTGKPKIIADASTVQPITQNSKILDLYRQLAPQSLIILPLVARGQTFGTMMLAIATPNRQYDALDLAVATDLAHRAAIAIDNAYLYEKAQEASRLKDEFLMTLSHELRTPLNTIVGWSQMLQYRQLSQQTTEQALGVIGQKAKALTQIIYDLLSLSQIVTGQIRLRCEPIKLDVLIQDVVESIYPAATAKAIHFITELDSSLPPIWGDARYLRQAIWNLLSNAVKFTPSEGCVDIRLFTSEQAIQLMVCDTGEGIAPEILPHIFDTFRQADSSSTRYHEGMGIGLSLVRHLVHLHGGTIQAFSEGEGEGATFIVTLPLLRAIPTLEERSSNVEGSVDRSRSVEGSVTRSSDNQSFNRNLVTDAQLILNNLRVFLVGQFCSGDPLVTQLEHDGATILMVTLDTDAMELLTQFDPDVLLVNLQNRAIGDETMNLLAYANVYATRTNKRLPAIALTEHRSEPQRLQALSTGFSVYLSLDTHPTEIATIIGAIAR